MILKVLGNGITYIVLLLLCIISISGLSQSENTSTISRNALLAIGKIDLEVENFDFDVEYEVISYVVSAVIEGFNYEIENRGEYFSQRTIDLIKGLKRGQKIYFENIKVKGPDGRLRILEPLILRLK